jgi:Na+/proline symporter
VVGCVVYCYFFVIHLVVGVWAGRNVEDNEDYVVAGQRLPIHMAGSLDHGDLVRSRNLDGGFRNGV